MAAPTRRRVYESVILKQSFWAAFFTTSFTEFTQTSALLIDGIVVSRALGHEEVGAVGVSAPLFFLVGMLASCFGGGLQIVCSRELGRGNTERVNDYLNETVMAAGSSALLLFFLVCAGASPLAYCFGARGKAANLLVFTQQYMRGLSFEFVPFILMSVLIPIILMDNGSRIVMISSVCGAVTDILFDLIAVRGGFGVFGVGLATSLSVLVSFLCLMLHFRKKNRLIRLRRAAVRREDILEVIRLGLPKGVHELAGILRPIALNALIVSVSGGVGMSVMSVRTSLSDFMEIPAMGVAGAVGLLAGVGYGERNGEDVEEIHVLSFRYLAMSSAVLFTVLVLSARPVAALYFAGFPEAEDLMRYVVYTIAAGIFLTGMVQVRIRYLQVTEHIKEAQVIEAAANLVILLLSAYILSVPFGIKGVYAAFPVSQFLVLALTWLANVLKRKKLRVSRRDFLRLDEGFYPGARGAIEYPVVSIEECVASSEQVYLFCKGHKMSREKTYHASLCMEEVTTNIVRHGFKRPHWHNAAEIRVTVSEEDLILRIRDNGVEFDIRKMAEILRDKKDPIANIGIKLIVASAKRMEYYRSWGSNVTILWV